MSLLADNTPGNRRSLMDVYETTVSLRLLTASFLTHGSKSMQEFQVTYLTKHFMTIVTENGVPLIYMGKAD